MAFFLKPLFYDLTILKFRSHEIDLHKNLLMKRRAITFLILLVITSCTRKETFKVEGRVADTTLNGSKVYLVALDAPISLNVDSTIILDGQFAFEKKADSLCVKILRVPVRFPNAVEDLVVITEAGKLNVVLSGYSHGEGTRLNNILQGWKDKKHAYDSTQFNLYSIKNRAENQVAADSLMKVSETISKSFMSEMIRLMNDNLQNGIGLLLFKVYYHALPRELKNRILEITGDTYTDKDAQLKLMISNDQKASK
jgi:hypothetical protein